MAGTDTEMGGPGCAFPSTAWSRIVGPGGAEGEARAFDLERLATSYWKPVYVHLRRAWSRNADEAKDLTQQFFLEEILEGRLHERFSPDRGSFRAFLKGALTNFMSHVAERTSAQKRGGHLKFLSLHALEGNPESLLQGTDLQPPDQALDRAWKRVVLERAAALLKDRLAARGKAVVFEVFRRYDLEPDGPDVSYQSVSALLGLSPDTVKNHLTKARDEFLAAVVEVVRDSVGTTRDLSTELKELFGI